MRSPSKYGSCLSRGLIKAIATVLGSPEVSAYFSCAQMNGHMAGPYQHRPVGPQQGSIQKRNPISDSAAAHLKVPAGPQSNIVCAHCSTLLLYPQVSWPTIFGMLPLSQGS